MSNSKITQALTNLFEKQRIVFWYDNRLEFRADFESLELPGVEKIELANNEFGVKYRILREQPEQSERAPNGTRPIMTSRCLTSAGAGKLLVS